MDSFKSTGNFYLSKSSNLKVVFIDQLRSCTVDAFDTSIFRNGELVITEFDKTNQIISGTFDFALFNNKCGDTIKITNGRFDMKY